MAGLDGIKNKIHPGDAMDKDLYDLPAEELQEIPTVCGSLREAMLEILDADREFLKAGGVFDDDQIDAYIELRMKKSSGSKCLAAPGKSSQLAATASKKKTFQDTKGRPWPDPFFRSIQRKASAGARLRELTAIGVNLVMSTDDHLVTPAGKNSRTLIQGSGKGLFLCRDDTAPGPGGIFRAT